MQAKGLAGSHKGQAFAKGELLPINRRSSLRVLYPLLSSRHGDRQKGYVALALLSQTLESSRATFPRQRYEWDVTLNVTQASNAVPQRHIAAQIVA